MGVSLVSAIRDAELDEIAELEALQLRSALIWEEYREQLWAHPEAVAIPEDAVHERRVRVAVGPSGTLGFSVVLPLRAGTCELDGLFVDPKVMRRGVGRDLLTDVIDRAQLLDAATIELAANPRAAAFYLACGFVSVGRIGTAFGEAVRMRLPLTQLPFPIHSSPPS